MFHGSHDDKLEVTFKGEMRRYKLHHVLEFDATRKRMSVIVENEKGEELKWMKYFTRHCGWLQCNFMHAYFMPTELETLLCLQKSTFNL